MAAYGCIWLHTLVQAACSAGLLGVLLRLSTCISQYGRKHTSLRKQPSFYNFK